MSRTVLCMVGCALVLAISATGFCSDKVFNVGSGDWSTDLSWNPVGSPQAGDTAFINNGRSATVSTTGQLCNVLRLENGSLNVTAGALNANDLVAGVSGTGSVSHTGGTVTLNSSLSLGAVATYTGQYTLSNASVLQSVDEYIGDSGIGNFTQSGTASNTASGWLYLGKNSTGNGAYTLTSGTLSALSDFIGYGGTGVLTQASGTTSITDQLQLGSLSGGNGTYNLNGGSVSTYDLIVGSAGAGALNIGNSSASASISHLLSFGTGGQFQAVAGSAVHLSNASLQNASTTPSKFTGLQNTTMYFSGAFSMLEVACLDKGSDSTGYVGNFSLNGLDVGDGSTTGYVKLVDDVANQSGSEALYVRNLIVTSGSTLDLNGIHLYYDTLTNLGGTITGGTVIQVGAPASGQIPGDFNTDGIVNYKDYIILEQYFGTTNASSLTGDANNDGIVNYKDYIILEQNFGKTSAPEPATLCLLALGGLLGLRRK